MVFTKGRGGVTEVPVAIPPLFWQRKVLLNSDFRKQQSGGDMKITYMRNETKSISVRVTQLLVNSLINELLSKVLSFIANNLLDVSIYVFQHDGILYRSWIAFTVCLHLSQGTPLHRYVQ